MKLTMAVYGFFVLPMRGDRCAGVLAPANVGPDAEHRTELLIDGVVDASSVPGVPAGGRPASSIALNTCRLQLGAPAPATVTHFDFILDVGDLFCSAMLDPRYASRGHVNVAVDFSGGTVGAAADLHTASQEWTLPRCSGGGTSKRRLTSLVVYELDDWSGRLDVVGLGTAPAAPSFLQFSGPSVTLALRNVPIDANPSFAQVNSHHKASTKPLLEGFTRENDSFLKTERDAADVPRASLSPLVRSFLGLESSDTGRRRRPGDPPLTGIRFTEPVPFEGDPHCSMRKAQVPRRPLPEHLDAVRPPAVPRRS